MAFFVPFLFMLCSKQFVIAWPLEDVLHLCQKWYLVRVVLVRCHRIYLFDDAASRLLSFDVWCSSYFNMRLHLCLVRFSNEISLTSLFWQIADVLFSSNHHHWTCPSPSVRLPQLQNSLSPAIDQILDAWGRQKTFFPKFSRTSVVKCWAWFLWSFFWFILSIFFMVQPTFPFVVCQEVPSIVNFFRTLDPLAEKRGSILLQTGVSPRWLRLRRFETWM